MAWAGMHDASTGDKNLRALNDCMRTAGGLQFLNHRELRFDDINHRLNLEPPFAEYKQYQGLKDQRDFFQFRSCILKNKKKTSFDLFD